MEEPEAGLDLELLLGQMTVEEKIGQLNLVSADVAWTGANSVNPTLHFETPLEQLADIRAGLVTGVFNLAGAERIRTVQRIAVEESRLGIPLLFGADVIHGFRTIFPVPLAEAAGFDPAFATEVANAVAAEAAAEGIHWTFAPGADLCRDARWGRAMESCGEDVLLASRMAAARVRGFQGDDLSDPCRLMATVKHFAGYGAAESGMDYNTAELSATTLADCYLPPYRAGIEAGAGAVMTAFNDLDGVPASANQPLLTGLLRQRWGFRGFTVSDYNSDVETIAHGFASDRREAARQCFNAGLDMCMASGLYLEQLPSLLADGSITMDLLDASVMRILQAKQALGLFHNPYRGLDVKAPALRTLAREAARRCPVLLKNAGDVLPLERGAKVALIGPFAREQSHLNGAWAIFGDNGQSIDLATGLTDALGGDAVSVVQGCEIDRALDGGIDAAVAVARGADVVILALGEGQYMSGESRSRAELSVPEPQLALARSVRAVAKRVVVLLRTGRPLVIGELSDLADAVLVTWFLGTETGHAVADVLTDKAAPRGRLPMSFPRHVGQVPLYYARKATGRPAEPTSPIFTTRYIDVENGPLYPFGHGLTYGRVSYGQTEPDAVHMAWDGALTVRCTLTETAGRAAEELVQLYVHDVAARRIRPVRELKSFCWHKVPANGSVVASFEISRDDLTFDDLQGGRSAEPGAFEIWIAPDSQSGQPARFVLDPP
jgi:beta-glucosidase